MAPLSAKARSEVQWSKCTPNSAEVLADVAEHGVERQLEHVAEAVGAEQLAARAISASM